MEKRDYIENLLKKFKTGELSPLEAKELASLAKDGDKNEAFKSALENLWQELPETATNFPSDKIWQSLKQNLQNESEVQSIPLKSKPILELKTFLRYAAIIILSIGLTWFTKDYLNGNDDKAITDTESDVESEVAVSYGSKSKVTLPDGSVVSLNSGSTLRYPAHFDRSARSVYVEGEAFFDVKKDTKHPFLVKTKEITIKVLGTKFNVKSYPDEKNIQTTLVTGSIEIYSSHNEITDKFRLFVLKPNQQVTFEKARGEISVTDQPGNSNKTKAELIKQLTLRSEIDMASTIAWKDNRLVFKDESFADLSRKLERWYDVDIEIKDDDLAKVLFSGVFVKENIEQALNALKYATPFKYQIKDNHIIISK